MKLICFGDSFIDGGVNGFDDGSPRWFDILAEKLGVEETKNFGKWGSNFNYQLVNLYRYLNSEDYDKTDYIIFTIPDSYRMPLVHPRIPPQVSVISTMNPDNKTFKFLSLAEFSATWNKYYNSETQEALVYTLLGMLSSLENKVLVINGTDNYQMQEKFPILADGNLFQLSDESGAWPFSDGTQANHFFSHTHKHLAEAAYKYFVDGVRFDTRQLVKP
jgi:hypothetical protein